MERVFEAADQMSRLLFENGLKNMDFSWIFSEGGMAAAVVTGVIALLMILFGAKCKYLLFALQGFLTGVTAGLAVSWFFNLDGWVMIGISAAAGVILAAFEAVFRKFGAFVFFLCGDFCKCSGTRGRQRISGTWNCGCGCFDICGSFCCFWRSDDHSGHGNRRRRTWRSCSFPVCTV